MTSAAPSTLSLMIFYAIVMTLAAVFLYAVVTAGAGRTAPAETASRWVMVGVALLVIWLCVPAVLAARGMLTRYDPPAPLMLLIASLTIGTILLAFSKVGARLASGISLAALVGFQAFRLPLEWLLHRLYTEGVLPQQMTWSGYNFDVVTGVTALLLGLWLARGRYARAAVLGWNVLGLALLLTIMFIASASTPGRTLFAGPPNTITGSYPWVWLPCFLVQAALFGHILVFRALAARARERTPERA